MNIHFQDQNPLYEIEISRNGEKRQWQIGNGKNFLRERRDRRSKKYDVGRFE